MSKLGLLLAEFESHFRESFLDPLFDRFRFRFGSCNQTERVVSVAHIPDLARMSFLPGVARYPLALPFHLVEFFDDFRLVAEAFAQLDLEAVVVGALRVDESDEAGVGAGGAVDAFDGLIEVLDEETDAQQLADGPG